MSSGGEETLLTHQARDSGAAAAMGADEGVQVRMCLEKTCCFDRTTSSQDSFNEASTSLDKKVNFWEE